MIRSRCLTATLSLSVLPVLLSGCGSDEDPGVLVPEVAEAPGGEKGKPGGGGGNGGGGDDGGQAPAPVLEEYFITEVDGVQHVHVVVSGSVSTVRLLAVLDHFHNGLRDDDPPLDTHYEYILPRAGESSAFESVPGHDGLYHADVAFAGTYENFSYQDSVWVTSSLPDYPYLDVDNAGGDPWLVGASVLAADSTSSAGSIDVIEGTNVIGHGVVESFAVHAGTSPSQETWVQTLGIDAISCTTSTVRSGKGKDRTVETVATIQADASFALGATDPDPNLPWVEMHLMDVATGALGARYTITEDAATAPLVLEVPGTGPHEVVAVIDYVFAGPSWGVYDPLQNQVETTAGASSTPFAGITALGDAPPFARSEAVVVDCS